MASIGSRAKAGVLVAVLLFLAVEGVLLVRYYDRYYFSGSAPSSAPIAEGSILKEPTAASAGASSEGADDADAADPNERTADEEASFDHRATEANSRGDYTYLDRPAINGDPNAVVLVEPSAADRGGEGESAYGHNVGVWYEPRQKKWAIFNQDLAPVPVGAAFEVVVPPADEVFVHRAALLNIVGSATYLDDPVLNGEPNAGVSVTHNWNPGGGGGVYNDHPVGVLYDEDAGEWFVRNEDGARMPEGAAFNIAVSVDEPAR